MFDMYKFLKVGQKVWRAKWDKVEEGLITKTSLGIYDTQGIFTEVSIDYKGKEKIYTMYYARFGGYQIHIGGHWYSADYESQTYQWKFFDDEAQAYLKLSEECENRADKNRKQVKEWETLSVQAFDKHNFLKGNK